MSTLIKHKLLALCLLLQVYTIGQTVRFQTLTIKDGLSQSATNCIYQDKLGYIWIGTQDGLNRFDGVEFKIFKHIVNSDKSLTSSYINTIVSDSVTGIMYIGTQNGGVNTYNPKKKVFKSISTIKELKDATINALLIHKGKLYIGSSKQGLLFWT